MRTWMRTITVIGLLLVTVCAVGANGRHGGRWWETEEIAQALNLNEGDIQQLNEAYNVYSLRMIDLKSRVDAERFKLQTVLEKEDLDEAAVNEQYDRLEKVRALLGKERFGFFVDARKIIGPQRFHQLMEIYKERRAKRKAAEADSKK